MAVPKHIAEKLRTAREFANFERASFSFKDERLILHGRTYPDDKRDWIVDDFIKERTRLWRESWLLPILDELLEWAGDEKPDKTKPKT